jgi:Domain of unknown function (DUF6798)
MKGIRAPGPIQAVLPYLLAGVAFAAAYGQAPLYYSNQNQYFLHGMADAGHGLLSEDWLANTLDPTPVFSALVAFTFQFAQPWLFHLYHAFLQGVYAASLLGLFLALAPEGTARRWPVFIALLVAVHAALSRWLSYRLLGADYPWYLQSGVAGQYVLGAMFQPSVFGVLLVAAITLFVRGRPVLAVVSLALAATVHPTYLLPAGMLTAGLLAALVLEGHRRQALALGALALVLVLPSAAYALLNFAPTSPEVSAAARTILVNLRIPHHTRPELWLDPIAGVQIAWMILGIALTWGTRLFPVLVVPFVLSVALTLIQVATASQALALLFPWRVSAVLVPVATAVVLTRLVSSFAFPRRAKVNPLHSPLSPSGTEQEDGGSPLLTPLSASGRGVSRGVAFVLLTLVVGGLWISFGRLAFRMAEEELAVMDFVRSTKAPGDVYFLPVRVPELARTTRGSLSSDFKPLPEKRKDDRIIPVDLQRFRLTTGAPIFIDFKSIPYKDTEVVEWHDRLLLARSISEQLRKGQFSRALAELRRQKVTHLVQPATQELSGPGLEEVYHGQFYRVYRLTNVSSPE